LFDKVATATQRKRSVSNNFPASSNKVCSYYVRFTVGMSTFWLTQVGDGKKMIKLMMTN